MGRPHIDQTIESLAAVDLNDAGPTEELAARREIREIDKRIANFETALGLSEDPDSLAGFTRRIERARAERKTAELRLRQATTGTGLTEAEIRAAAGSLADAISLLSAASLKTAAVSTRPLSSKCCTTTRPSVPSSRSHRGLVVVSEGGLEPPHP